MDEDSIDSSFDFRRWVDPFDLFSLMLETPFISCGCLYVGGHLRWGACLLPLSGSLARRRLPL